LSEREYNPYAAPSRDDEQPPESEGVDPTLASLMQRFAGALIDGGVMAIAAGLGLYFALMDLDLSDMSTLMVSLFAPWMIPVLAVSGVQWAMISSSGQSIGKRVVGIRIVRLRGSRPGFVYGVALRALVPGAFQAFAAFLLPPAWFVLPLIDAGFVLRKDRRSLRDHMAATKVIQVEVRR
jgi:uncharacterized RDD family membrane protein YckC